MFSLPPPLSLLPPSLHPPSLHPPSLSLPSCSWLFACATAQKIVSVDDHLIKQETAPQNSQTGHTESGEHPSGRTESESGEHPSGRTESGEHPSGRTESESGEHPSGRTESGEHPSGRTESESGGVSLEKPSEQIKLPFKPNFDVKVETWYVLHAVLTMTALFPPPLSQEALEMLPSPQPGINTVSSYAIECVSPPLTPHCPLP